MVMEHALDELIRTRNALLEGIREHCYAGREKEALGEAEGLRLAIEILRRRMETGIRC
jgi:hypothetical protein